MKTDTYYKKYKELTDTQTKCTETKPKTEANKIPSNQHKRQRKIFNSCEENETTSNPDIFPETCADRGIGRLYF